MNTITEKTTDTNVEKTDVHTNAKAFVKPSRRIAQLRKPKIVPFTYTLGADPELMIWDIAQNRIVSSIPILKRDKHNPIDLGDGMFCYADNVLMECRMNPCNSGDEMINALKTVFGRMQSLLGAGYKLLPQASHVYTDAEMEPYQYGKYPHEVISPVEIGCVPSIDIYRERIVAPSEFPDNMRTGSFHIHLGNANWRKKNNGELLTFQSRKEAIRLMDIFVGVPSVIIDKDPTAAVRRKIYGMAGNARITPYGTEYRTLAPGNLSNPEMTKLILDLTDYAMSFIVSNTQQDVMKLVNSDLVESAINNCNIEQALEVLNAVKLPQSLLDRVVLPYDQSDFGKAWGIV